MSERNDDQQSHVEEDVNPVSEWLGEDSEEEQEETDSEAEEADASDATSEADSESDSEKSSDTEDSAGQEQSEDDDAQSESSVLDELGLDLETPDTSAEKSSEPDKATRGVLNDLQKERERRRAEAERADRLQRELDQLKSGDNRSDSDTDEEDSEFISKSDVKKAVSEAVADVLKTQEEQQQKVAQQKFAETILESESQASQRFTTEKVGVGLDYKTVTTVGEDNLSSKDIAAIRKSSDPATEFYKRCIERTPSLMRLVEVHRKAKAGKSANGKTQTKPQKAAASSDAGEEAENRSDSELVNAMFG